MAGGWRGTTRGADQSQAGDGLEGHIQGLHLGCVIFLVPRINMIRIVFLELNLRNKGEMGQTKLGGEQGAWEGYLGDLGVAS